MDYESKEGPILKGDILVLEIGGKLVPKRPDDPKPQWFVALADQHGRAEIPLKPMEECGFYKPRKYAVGWKA